MESLKELRVRALGLGVDESTVSHRGRKQPWLDAIEKKIEEALLEVSETEREAIISDDHATAESLGLEVDRLLDIYSQVIKTQMSLLCPRAEAEEPVIVESASGRGTIDIGEGERQFRKVEGDFILETSNGNLVSSAWYPTRNNRYFLALRKFYENKAFAYSDSIEWHSNRTGTVMIDKEKHHFNVEDFGGEVRPPRVVIYDTTSGQPRRLSYHKKPYVYSECPHRLAVLRALGCES